MMRIKPRPMHAYGTRLSVLLLFTYTVFVAPSVFAISYNYFLDGERFDIVGMFDCTTLNLDDCRTPSEVTNWMFATSGIDGEIFPLVFTSNDAVLFALNPATLTLDLCGRDGNCIFLVSGEYIIAGNPYAAGGAPATEIVGDINATPVITEKVSPAVPEPSTLLLLGTGLAGLASYRWFQRRNKRDHVD